MHLTCYRMGRAIAEELSLRPNPEKAWRCNTVRRLEGAIAKVPSTKPLGQIPEKMEYGASWAIGVRLLDLPDQRDWFCVHLLETPIQSLIKSRLC